MEYRLQRHSIKRFSGDINEENNVIRLHLRRTERVLNDNEIRYFQVRFYKSPYCDLFFIERHVKPEITIR